MSRYTDPTNPETVVERCVCDYVDVGIGSLPVALDPDCPVHVGPADDAPGVPDGAA